MKSKYLTVLKIFLIIFLTVTFEKHWPLDHFFIFSLAWGAEENSITSTEKWQKLLEICGQREISGENLDQILKVIRQAEGEGFPAEVFLNKALEGVAKRASTPVIVKVLQEKLEHFHTCHTILEQMPGIEKETAFQKQQTLAILAESLSRGVSGQELKELSNLASNPCLITLGNAAENLAILKDLGFSAVDAREITHKGLQRGLYRQREQEMASAIREARQKGISLQELKSRILTNIARGRGMRGIIQLGKSNKEPIRKEFRKR